MNIDEIKVKYCKKCGKKISDINEADYFSHIRIKYCRECGPDANRENARERSERIRKQTRNNNKLARELNNALLQENKLLRDELERVRSRLND